ncbi:PAF1 RNA polymerase II complex component leo1 [Cyclospora cayetanensis]|uniref:PAF1 RNA polymerase II complex component leo1 n=1 Tax=Cyclospora cayetanensis TaxID=88456 RepID=A0A1D3CWE1_9EIME|nr:PAF1 RNA polymerase II complex component leo1 [Cyclospora cayetanensis]
MEPSAHHQEPPGAPGGATTDNGSAHLAAGGVSVVAGVATTAEAEEVHGEPSAETEEASATDAPTEQSKQSNLSRPAEEIPPSFSSQEAAVAVASPNVTTGVAAEGTGPETAAEEESLPAVSDETGDTTTALSDEVTTRGGVAPTAPLEGDKTADVDATAAEEDLFGPGDGSSHEGSLASDADLFGDLQPSPAASIAAESDSELAPDTAGPVVAFAAPLTEEEAEGFGEEESASQPSENLPPQQLRLRSSWYTSNCRLVEFSDGSYCLFVDDKGFECNTKDDVSYIFESTGSRGPLCSVMASEKRLQVLMPTGLGASSFFSKCKSAGRSDPKSRTALTATELVEAAETAEQQSFLARQEAARSRRALTEAQRGLTRGFLEAEESDNEDEQGASLEKIKERFKRKRFL